MFEVSREGGLFMGKRKEAGAAADHADGTEPVRLTKETARMLRVIVAARGPEWTLATVVDELLAAELPAVHAAAERDLEQIRAIRARAASRPRSGRKGIGG